VTTPGFFQHLFLLWGLRLRIGLNRGEKAGRSGRVVAVLAFIGSSAPSVLLAASFFSLMRLPMVANSSAWPDFILRLLSFVTTCVWVTWPVLSAGVDDHSELSRYAAFPISSVRLLTASTLASLFEPRALVFYGPLVGATLGYVTVHPPHAWAVVALTFAAYVLFNAALSRVGLHIVLNVLKQQRSAELIGGGFILFLFAASFIPPVDTTWLFRLKEVGVQAVPDTLIRDAVLALGRVPSGWFAHGLSAAVAGDRAELLADLLGTVELLVITMVVAWGLLLQFHRDSGRGGVASGQLRQANPFQKTTRPFTTLLTREALDLWHNPRARLLAAVPFVLGILVKLLSGRDLFVFFLGESADAWLLGGFAVYGAIVMGSTFSQNAFAYDGHGFTVFLAAPVELGAVLKAKNVVHATAGALLAALVTIFYVSYFHLARWLDVGCALLAVAALIPVLLTAGNFLSLFFPVKFHADLKRRDKLPFVASMLGVAAASVGTSPFAMALRHAGTAGPDGRTLLEQGAAVVVAWLVYRLTLPLAVKLLERRRELVLRAVTRE